MLSLNLKPLRKAICIFSALLCFVSLFAGRKAYADNSGDFANGTDTAVISNTEYFINADDEDRLYFSTQSGSKLILNEHIITLIPHGSLIYLLIYENEHSTLSVFNTVDSSLNTVIEFENTVTSLARCGSILYFVLNGSIEFYNTSTKTFCTFKAASNIQFVYFTDAHTLKYFDGTGIKGISLNGKTSLSFDSDEKGSEKSSTYKPRLTAPDKHDPYYTSLNPLHRGGYGMVDNGGNCTCYAYGRSYENLGYDPKLCTRAAGKWYAYNKDEGRYAYGKEPALGAVAVWTKDGGDGHVAVVEIIDGDTIITSESGWQTFYFKTVSRSLNDSDLSASSAYSFQGFIYVMGFNNVQDDGKITFDSISLPDSIICGSPFPLKGSIISLSSKLTLICASVTDLDGNVMLSKEVAADTYIYDLADSEIDKALTFGVLAPNSYIFHYTAISENEMIESYIHSFTVEPAPTPITGDINSDGEVNSRDIAKLQKFLATLTFESEISPIYDIDSNGRIDSRDISKLQKLIWEAE